MPKMPNSMPSERDVSQGRQYVTLSLDSELFAVDVSRVREILDLGVIARLPNAPPFLLGMIDLRGECVAVIDLRSKLGLPAVDRTTQTRILVLDVEVAGRGLVLGLLADRVLEVTPLDGGLIGPPPDIGTRWHSDYIEGVGRRGDRLVVVFDLTRLFSADEVALIVPQAAA